MWRLYRKYRFRDTTIFKQIKENGDNMYGAIIGDIIGSVYELESVKTEDFELLPDGSRFTDDTVLTIAVADSILNNIGFAEAYHKWGNKCT